ncbi:hypothetical protein E2C01_025483 [Portunus trituberculatus]|uniref:Uncharacterized protein n=1 Tax=Portunus trituberculatus TaxID=210409 RepID=A0A5B7EFQ1_PORTR|nr:hypothetical protein [Portunus trituberculatus]
MPKRLRILIVAGADSQPQLKQQPAPDTAYANILHVGSRKSQMDELEKCVSYKEDLHPAHAAHRHVKEGKVGVPVPRGTRKRSDGPGRKGTFHPRITADTLVGVVGEGVGDRMGGVERGGVARVTTWWTRLGRAVRLAGRGAPDTQRLCRLAGPYPPLPLAEGERRGRECGPRRRTGPPSQTLSLRAEGRSCCGTAQAGRWSEGQRWCPARPPAAILETERMAAALPPLGHPAMGDSWWGWSTGEWT